MNWYAYCGNDPVNFIDPEGMRPIQDVAEGITYDERTGDYFDPSGGKIDKSEAVKEVVERYADRMIQQYPQLFSEKNLDSLEFTMLCQFNMVPRGSDRLPGLSIGGSFSGPEYGLSVATNGLWGLNYTKTFSPTNLWGGSIDIAYGSGRIETTIGANRFLSIGLLKDFNDNGSLSIGGVAIHLGTGSSTQVSVTFAIPGYCEPFPGFGD